MKSISIFFCSCLLLWHRTPKIIKTSGLNARQFHKYWKVESESPDYKVTFRGDTAEITFSQRLNSLAKRKDEWQGNH